MADMIKFHKGLVASLPAAGANGAFYVTIDEGAMYLGTGTGMKRLGDFVQVANVASLPEKAHESCLYYCVAENILAKWNGTEWKQINKQPSVEELKVNLNLGSAAYEDASAFDASGAATAAETAAKNHADGLNAAMDTRVVALESAIGENSSVATQIKTAIEALDFTDTAVDGEYVSAVNEVDGKISVTRKALPDYSNTYEAKGAAATALDNAKAYADGLAANYDEKGAAAGVKTELTTEIAKKVDKVEGYSLVADDEIARLAEVDNYDDTALAGRVTIVENKFANYTTTADQNVIDNEQNRRLGVIEGDYLKAADIANFETKENVQKVTNDLAAYIESNDAAVADRYTKTEADNKFAVKGKDSYDDTEVRGLITAETNRATGIEGGLRTDVDAIKGDYLKGADKTALQEQITANTNAITLLTDGVDADKVDGVKDLIDYVETHGTEVTGMKADIAANTKAIEDEAKRAGEAEEALSGRLDTLEAIDHDAYVGAIATAKSELQNEIDADVKVVNDALEAYKTSNDAEVAKKANSADVYTKTEINELLTWGEF